MPGGFYDHLPSDPMGRNLMFVLKAAGIPALAFGVMVLIGDVLALVGFILLFFWTFYAMWLGAAYLTSLSYGPVYSRLASAIEKNLIAITWLFEAPMGEAYLVVDETNRRFFIDAAGEAGGGIYDFRDVKSVRSSDDRLIIELSSGEYPLKSMGIGDSATAAQLATRLGNCLASVELVDLARSA